MVSVVRYQVDVAAGDPARLRLPFGHFDDGLARQHQEEPGVRHGGQPGDFPAQLPGIEQEDRPAHDAGKRLVAHQ